MMYILEGNPVPLARARLAGPERHVYDAQKMLKHRCGLVLLQQHGLEPMFTQPLHLDAVFYMEKPFKHRTKLTEKGKPNKQYKEDGAAHSSYPDLDNLVKFLCDVCNGVILKNDKIIWSMNIRKEYDNRPRTEFTLTEVS